MQQSSYIDTYMRATSRTLLVSIIGLRPGIHPSIHPGIHYRVLHLYMYQQVSAYKSVAVLFQTLEKMLQNLYSGSLPNKMTPTTPKRIEISDPH